MSLSPSRSTKHNTVLVNFHNILCLLCRIIAASKALELVQGAAAGVQGKRPEHHLLLAAVCHDPRVLKACCYAGTTSRRHLLLSLARFIPPALWSGAEAGLNHAPLLFVLPFPVVVCIACVLTSLAA